ncbi:MAG: tetratricopeptide repeat protein, partial [Methylococcales bacterium]|nr:tetratricopeptide repeat protein [Methylococcales bacterium]
MRTIKLLFFLASLALLGCDKTEEVQEYIKNGKALYKEGSYKKARIEFKNAIQADNQQADAFYHLALMDEQDRNITDMYKNLGQTIQIDPENIEARLKLATLLLLSNDIERVNEQIVEILKRSENHSDALALKAAVFLKEKKIDESVKIVDAILLKDAGNLSAIQLKVALYSEDKKFTEALGVVNKALENNTIDKYRLNLLKLQLLFALKDYAALEKHYIVLIKNFPNKLEFSYRLADYYFQRKEEAKSVAVLKDTIAKNPEVLAPKLALIKILTLRDPKQAEAQIKEYLVKTPKAAGLYFSLAKLYNAQKQPEKSVEQLHLVIKNSENEQAKSNARILLATNEKDPKIAKGFVDDVLAVDEHHLGALLLKAKFQLMKGAYDDAIVDLRGLLKDYPESDQALVFLAEAYSKINSPELANDHFRKALTINPSNNFAMEAVVAKMLADKNFIGAEETVKTVLESNPNNFTALLKLAEVRFLQKDWTGAEEVVALIEKQPDGIGQAKYVKGRIFQGQKRYEEAIVEYKQSLAKSENLYPALESMMISYEALKQRPLMHAYLANYLKTHSDQPQAMSLQAQLYMLDKNWEKELAVLTRANQKWPKISALYQRMAALFLMKKEDGNAIKTYKRGINNLSENIYLTMNLAALYEKSQDYTKSVALYEDFLVKRPKDDIAVNNLVSLLVDHFPTPENLKRALELAKPFSESKHATLFDTYGWVLLANDKTEEAITVFKKVIEKAPKVAVFRYHLAKAYMAIGSKTGAVSELETALKIAE